MLKYVLIGCAAVGVGFLLYKIYSLQKANRQLEEAMRNIQEKARLFQEIQTEQLYAHPPFPAESVLQPTVPTVQLEAPPVREEDLQGAVRIQPAGGVLDALPTAVTGLIQQAMSGNWGEYIGHIIPGPAHNEESLLMTEQRTAGPEEHRPAEPEVPLAADRKQAEDDVSRAVDQFLDNESETGLSASTPVQSVIRIIQRRTPLRISPRGAARSSPARVEEVQPPASPVVMQAVEEVRPPLTHSALEKMNVKQMAELAVQLGINPKVRNKQGRLVTKTRSEFLQELSAHCNTEDELRLVA